MADEDIARRGNNYKLTGWKLWIQKHIIDLGMFCDEVERVPWDEHICHTCIISPVFFLAGCCFPCLFACLHREQQLWDRMDTEYSCCQGKYGKCYCTPWVRCCPHCCLCLEVHVCTGCAIGGNRELMKQKYPIEDRLCETVVLLISSALGTLGCFVNLVTCWTNGCLNAQLEHEMVQRTGKTNLLPYTMWSEENNLWDVQKCEPCCGEPCNPVDGAYCFLCFLCCPLCTNSKLLASSMDDHWALVNHVLPYLLACWLTTLPIPYINNLGCIALRGAQRHNARVRDGTGDPRHCFGDIVLGSCVCTSPCGLGQELRTYPTDAWDWLSDMRKGDFPNVMNNGDIVFIRRAKAPDAKPSNLEVIKKERRLKKSGEAKDV